MGDTPINRSTQPHMAKGANPPRHNIIWAHHIGGTGGFNDGHVQVSINIKPVGSGGNWDYVTDLIDITNDGNLPDQVSVIPSGPAASITLQYYGPGNNGAVIAVSHERKYKAIYNSTHEEIFDVLIPGYYQSVGYLWGYSVITMGTIHDVYPCLTNSPHFQFNSGINWGPLTNNNLYQFTQINIISDPSNIWNNGASLINLPLHPTLGTSPDFRFVGLNGSQDNFYLSNTNGGGTATTYNVDPGQSSAQKIAGIVANIDSNLNVATAGGGLSLVDSFTNTNWAGGATIPWNDLQSGFGNATYITNYGTATFPFVYYVEYAENLPSCNLTSYVIDGCTDINNMAYWGYTLEDCDGVAIPAAVIADDTLATWTPGSCCPDCINPLSKTDPTNYSSQPLTLHVNATDPTTVNGSDGYIDVTILNGGFIGAGVTSGLPTGVGNYTFVLENVNGAAMSGNSAGVNISSGSSLATTVNSFTFGFGVLGSNVNGGLLQTGAPGSASYVASSATGYVPASAGTTNSSGLKEGCYIVYVFDSSATVCLGEVSVCLVDPNPVIGCTDNNPGTNGGVALNFDANATIADNNNCHYCDASTGELIDGNTSSQISSDISTGIFAPSFNYPSNTTAVDGDVVLSGLLPTALFQTYINDVVAANGIQNADYMVALYKWTTQTSSGSFAASSIVGTAINNQGNGWDVALNTTTLGAGLTYGYYSIKIWISDPDAISEIEQCYEIIDFIIPVPACVDNGVATDALGNIISDGNLYFHDPTLCVIATNVCCDTTLLVPNINNDGCTIQYKGEIDCPLATHYHELILQYYNNGAWVDVVTNTYGNINNSSVVFSNAWNTGWIYNNSTFSVYGNGDYRIKWTSAIANQNPCVLYSNIETITIGIYGCTDPTAQNYNPLATCNDGCVYCVYGCTDGTTPALNYDPLATCDDGSCTYCEYGCMDITASNYNPLATCDDNSCIFDPMGCTNPLAINYDPAAVIDDGSCYFCPDPVFTYTHTTTDATVTPGSCLSNLDGCINITVDSTICTTTWKLVECYFFCGISSSNVILVTNVDYTLGIVATICNLAGGHTYTLILEDCNGCQMQIEIFVGTEGNTCGCTDPAADNYDPNATIDDGSCQYCGCTDPNAINYNPGATSNCIPDTCSYPSLTPPCVPASIQQTIKRLETCVSENGFDYYNKLVTGQSDDCSIMNVWKLILMTYLLKKLGLDCIYNCEDANTPDPANVYISCENLWITGGPSTGLNDSNVNTLTPAVGTTSDVAMFTTGSLTPGDVIKHHNSGYIWIFFGPGQNGPPTPVSVAGLDPENASGNLSGYWGFCNDSMRYISNTNNINYIDNFINFANKFCRDCENDPKLLTGSASNLNIPTLQQGIDGIDGIEI